MPLKKYVIVLCALLISATSIQAQISPPGGRVSGVVVDEMKKAFPYASVSLLNSSDSSIIKGTLTGGSGEFEFQHLRNGGYIVSIYVVGYKKAYYGPYQISVEKSAFTSGTVQLITDSKTLNGVEIVKQRPLIERQIDKTVINVENSALAAGNSALEILQKSPGVSVDREGNVSLRGKQGVAIMIDGKPTYLSTEQLANLLRSTEGNAIKAIELITNPSSKYDAAGNSGIINVRLKKNGNYGTNGTVTAGAGYGRYEKVNGGLTLNHRVNKLNVFGNVDYGKNKRYSGTDILRVNNTVADKTYFDQVNIVVRDRDNGNYKAGMDYFLNDRNTVGFVFNGYNSSGFNDSDVLTLIGNLPGETDSSVVAKNLGDYKYTGMSYNLNYKVEIDTSGQELSIDIDYSKYTGTENNDFNNNYLNPAGQVLKPAYLFRNSSPSETLIQAFKADYTYPLGKKMKFEAGLKSSLVKTDNNFLFENFGGSSWVNDPKRSNQFLYDENINAAYANLNRKFSGTTVQVGLRAEQTNSKGNSVTDSKLVKRHYLNLFPTVFVNHELSKNHDIGFSYSRRIDRPDYESLNPFISYLDLYSYSYGNPFLKPQYTNSFELSYAYKKTLNVTMRYSRTIDVISDVLLTDTATKTIFISDQNLATQDSYNINISAPLQIAKWWNSSNNITGYFNNFKTPDLLGMPYESGRLAFNFNTNQTITLGATSTVEWSGYYQSKQVYGTLLLEAQYGVDLGFSKSFMDKKLLLKLAVNDVFKLQRSTITSAMPSQNYKVSERWESRVYRITCSYRFGSNTVKAARERSGGADGERNRVKSGR